MVTASCLFLGGCVSEEQIDKFAEKYPGAFRFAVVAYIAQSAKQAEFEDFEFDEEEDEPYTKKEIEAKKREINDKYNEKLLEALLTKEDGSDSDQASQDSLKTTGTTVPQAQENTQTTEEKKPTGTITFTGSIDAGYSLSPLELVIDLDTGAVTGSFTGVYEWEGFESEYYTDPADTANGVADFSGTVELKTGTITGAGALEYTWQNAGTGETWPFAVAGTLSTDYKSAEGEFIFGEQGVWPWTAAAQ